ncbi:nucleotidyltransferase domain-containing protein [Thermodesulfobacteriota bacterium]
MQDVHKKIALIAKRFELDIIYVFGSLAEMVSDFVNGREGKLNGSALSDVDIGVKPGLGKHLSIKEKVQLSLALEDLFNINRVDLVIMTEADPFLTANIIRGERIFCNNEFEADEYDLYILRRAGDLVPLERERISLIMGAEINESE